MAIAKDTAKVEVETSDEGGSKTLSSGYNVVLNGNLLGTYEGQLDAEEFIRCHAEGAEVVYVD